LDHLRRIQSSIEGLKPGDTDAVHPVKIKLDAFLGDVAVHPMPPHARTRGCRRRLEAGLQGIGRVRRFWRTLGDPHLHSRKGYGQRGDQVFGKNLQSMLLLVRRARSETGHEYGLRMWADPAKS